MGFELGWICVWQNYGRLGFWRGEGLGDSYSSGHLHQSDCVYGEDYIAWGLSFPYICQERIGLPVMARKGFTTHIIMQRAFPAVRILSLYIGISLSFLCM